MKAEDLMLGDWVMLYGRPRKVGIIYDHERVEVDCIEEDCSEIEPIPLTPEILEKNTSESNKNVFGGMNYALNEDFFIENRGDRFCLSRRMAGHKYSTFWVCDIHYVHELQHFLRLIDCDKEIVL